MLVSLWEGRLAPATVAVVVLSPSPQLSGALRAFLCTVAIEDAVSCTSLTHFCVGWSSGRLVLDPVSRHSLGSFQPFSRLLDLHFHLIGLWLRGLGPSGSGHQPSLDGSHGCPPLGHHATRRSCSCPLSRDRPGRPSDRGLGLPHQLRSLLPLATRQCTRSSGLALAWMALCAHVSGATAMVSHCKAAIAFLLWLVVHCGLAIGLFLHPIGTRCGASETPSFLEDQTARHCIFFPCAMSWDSNPGVQPLSPRNDCVLMGSSDHLAF